MKDIETLISPFIENQFPSFYKDQGENFILFVKAYFEWLEQNHQLLTLESYTDFNVGDTLAQGTTTGKIVAYVDGELLVYVNGFDTFKCLSVCSDITPITSSSGGATIIKKGGRTKRMGSLFFARNLPKLRDIDKTIDIFILHFKEKYLKNIEFDTATNQRLLVKNSQDLYRSKGTERSIDLFFKLIYGVDTDVYYPADDLFRLSDGEWVVPQYLEIASPNYVITTVEFPFSANATSVTVGNSSVNGFITLGTNTAFLATNDVINYKVPTSNTAVGGLANNGNYYVIVANSTAIQLAATPTGPAINLASVGTGAQPHTLIRETVTATNRSIDLVGKQIKGVTSGATAFVEKYIKRKIKSGFVHIFNVSAVAGAFFNNEILVADDTIFDDSPRLIGSLNRVEIGAAAGTGFAVGDIVSFVNSGYGDYGLARVDAVADDTGIVDFIFLDGGWGYTSSSNSDLSALELAKRSQSIVSEKVLTLSNVVTSNTVDVINVTAGGLGYNNTDVITITTAFVNAVAKPTTNATGAIQFVTVTNPGSGFYTATVPTANIIVKNSSGGSTSSNATLTATTKVNKGYFNYFESFIQPKRTINYANATVVIAFSANSTSVTVGNSTVNGFITLGTNTAFLANNDIVNYRVPASNTAIGGLANNGNYYVIVANSTAIQLAASASGPAINLASVGTGAQPHTLIRETATAFTEGSLVRFGNSTVNTAHGVILSNELGTSANGVILISLVNGSFNSTNSMFLSGNSSVSSANLTGGVSNTSANAAVMGIPTEVTLTISSLVGSISRDNVLYQQLSTGEIIGRGIVSTTSLVGTSGSITISNVTGAFRKGYTLYNETVVGTTATITEVGLTVGLYNITGNYTNVYNAFVYSMNTATTANVVVVSQGTGAGFKVNALADTETVFLNTDLLGANNIGYSAANSTVMANQAFMSLPVANYAYGFPKSPQGNSASIIWSCLNFDLYELGTIGTLSAINPGADYNIDPYVLVRQPFISSLNYHDYNMTISGATKNFLPGEYIYQTSASLAQYNLVVSNETGYQVGEKVYQGASLAGSTANGIIVSISPTANSIQVKDVGGTFATSTALKSVVNVSLSATVLSSTLQTVTSSARGIVKAGSTTSVLKIKRINLENGFVAGQTISGQSTQANATIVSVAEDFDTLPIGFNASIQANVVTSNGTITALTVVDSGVGYSLNGSDPVEYRSEDGLRTGEAKLIIDGIGTGSGYFKSSKGFLSTNKYIHDGDYYQEYSYEILTKIPFLKYSDMFKKVMHTAGTRFFGSVLLENTATASVDVIDDSISNSTVSTIQFNSNSSVSANAILFDNDPTIFADGAKVTYYTSTGNTVLAKLANAATYYVTGSNATSIQLKTNPRTLSYSFNPNSSIISVGNSTVNSSFVSITRHNLNNGDALKYTTSVGNTAPTGLTNNALYFVVASNAAGISISATRAGANLTITPGANQTGHFFAIAPINITANTTASGAATNGHFIATFV